jgi:ABC-type Co2+ transport system permease subunit
METTIATISLPLMATIACVVFLLLWAVLILVRSRNVTQLQTRRSWIGLGVTAALLVILIMLMLSSTDTTTVDKQTAGYAVKVAMPIALQSPVENEVQAFVDRYGWIAGLITSILIIFGIFKPPKTWSK